MNFRQSISLWSNHEPSAWKCIWCGGLPRLLFLINEPLYACQISHHCEQQQKNANVLRKGNSTTVEVARFARPVSDSWWNILVLACLQTVWPSFFPRWISCLPTRFCGSRPIKEKISQRLAITMHRTVVFMFQNGLFINSYWSILTPMCDI